MLAPSAAERDEGRSPVSLPFCEMKPGRRNFQGMARVARLVMPGWNEGRSPGLHPCHETEKTGTGLI
jgi:hypothetical protein